MGNEHLCSQMRLLTALQKAAECHTCGDLKDKVLLPLSQAVRAACAHLRERGWVLCPRTSEAGVCTCIWMCLDNWKRTAGGWHPKTSIWLRASLPIASSSPRYPEPPLSVPSLLEQLSSIHSGRWREQGSLLSASPGKSPNPCRIIDVFFFFFAPFIPILLV